MFLFNLFKKKLKSPFEQKTQELFDLSKKIEKGIKGVDFAIEIDDGIARYEYTPIENEYLKITKIIRDYISLNPDLLTDTIFIQLEKTFSNSSKARDSFRGRTPANGGDWSDIESPLEDDIYKTILFLRKKLDEKVSKTN